MESPERSLPFAGVHPETLQHAAQRLRPTVYRESLLPHEREQFLDGSDQLAAGRYWTVHATHDYSNQSPAFGVNSGYSPSLSPSSSVPIKQQQSSNFNSNNNKINNQQQQQQYQQYSYKPQQKQMEIKIPIQLIGPLPGQTNFGPTNKSTYSPSPSPINSFIKQTTQQQNISHRQSPLLQSSSQQQLISDPKRYIHAYATQTPVATLMGQNGGERGGNEWNNNNNGGVHLRKQNVDNFVKELRDQGLTERQRAANQQQKPVNYQTSEPPPSLQNFASYKQKINSNTKEDSVDQLIKEMEWKMRSGYGAVGESGFLF
uniref:Uncharacterized protein n=1 Tax=Meloidogyne hapla TaxID=6305 RepID=A0A1I8B3R1_MELHA